MVDLSIAFHSYISHYQRIIMEGQSQEIHSDGAF